MEWTPIRCDWCGSGEQRLLQNRPGRKMCDWCFDDKRKEFTDFEECDQFSDPGAERKDVDLRSQEENDGDSDGESIDGEEDSGDEETDQTE